MSLFVKISAFLFLITNVCTGIAAEPAKKKPNIKELREAVSASFKDPLSSQYRNEIFKDGVLCGEVNSKNSYAAYVGFKRFVSVKNNHGISSVVDGVGFVAGDDSTLTTNLLRATADLEVQLEMSELLRENPKSRVPYMSKAEQEKKSEEIFFAKLWEQYCGNK